MPGCSRAPPVRPVSKGRVAQPRGDSPKPRENIVHKLLSEHLAGVGFNPDVSSYEQKNSEVLSVTC